MRTADQFRISQQHVRHQSNGSSPHLISTGKVSCWTLVSDVNLVCSLTWDENVLCERRHYWCKWLSGCHCVLNVERYRRVWRVFNETDVRGWVRDPAGQQMPVNMWLYEDLGALNFHMLQLRVMSVGCRDSFQMAVSEVRKDNINAFLLKVSNHRII